MTAYMLNLRDPDKTMLSAPGGKNVNLRELMRFANIIVPEGFSFITNAYHHTVFSNVRLNKLLATVRSSATMEDLPGASFAGQHDTY